MEMTMSKYNFVQFIPSPRSENYSATPFDRKTFDPINNEKEKRTLGRLRGPGGGRFFRLGWEKWINNKWCKNTNSSALSALNPSEIIGKTVIDAGSGDSADADIVSIFGGKGIAFDLFPRKESYHFPKSIHSPNGFVFYRKSDFKIQDICESWEIEKYSVDVVLSNAVIDLMSIPDRILFYKEVHKALKTGGILSTYIIHLKNGHGSSIYHERMNMESCGFKTEMRKSVIIATKL